MTSPCLVGDDQPVGIAVEGQAEIGAVHDHLLAHHRGGDGAAIAVDVGAVGLDGDRNHLGAELPQHGRRHLVGGAVGAIDDDLQAVERGALREAVLHELDVAARCVVDPLGAAEAVALRQLTPLAAIVDGHAGLDLGFDVVRQLVAVGPEQLDAVVLKRIVGGRDHDAEIGAHAARQHGDGRRRQRAGEHHIHAAREEAGCQGVFQHIAGKPRILADHDPMPVAAAGEMGAGGQGQLQRHVGRDGLAIGRTADAVGTEQPADGLLRWP